MLASLKSELIQVMATLYFSRADSCISLIEGCPIFLSLLVSTTKITDRVAFAIEQKLNLMILNGFLRRNPIFFLWGCVDDSLCNCTMDDDLRIGLMLC